MLKIHTFSKELKNIIWISWMYSLYLTLKNVLKVFIRRLNPLLSNYYNNVFKSIATGTVEFIVGFLRGSILRKEVHLQHIWEATVQNQIALKWKQFFTGRFDLYWVNNVLIGKEEARGAGGRRGWAASAGASRGGLQESCHHWPSPLPHTGGQVSWPWSHSLILVGRWAVPGPTPLD